jgi:hypothetical protein
MITYFLTVILLGFITVILSPFSFLPDATLPAGLGLGIAAAIIELGYVWAIAPLTFAALIAALVLFLLVEGYIFGYKIIMWIIKKIPTIN